MLQGRDSQGTGYWDKSFPNLEGAVPHKMPLCYRLDACGFPLSGRKDWGVIKLGNLSYNNRIVFSTDYFILESYWHQLDLEPSATVEFVKIDDISLASIISGRKADYRI